MHAYHISIFFGIQHDIDELNVIGSHAQSSINEAFTMHFRFGELIAFLHDLQSTFINQVLDVPPRYWYFLQAFIFRFFRATQR